MIKCENCGKKIVNKENMNMLIYLSFALKPFCNDCYALTGRNFSRYGVYSSYPINGDLFLFRLQKSIFAIIMCVLLLIFLPSEFKSLGWFTFLFILLGYFLIFSVRNIIFYFITKKKMSELR